MKLFMWFVLEIPQTTIMLINVNDVVERMITQPLGHARFLDSIERVTGQRREARPGGRPRKSVGKPVGVQ